MKQSILLTGGLGLVGSELLRRLLQWNPDCDVILALRGKGKQSAQQRFDALRHELLKSDPEFSGQVQILECNLAAPKLGLSPIEYQTLTEKVEQIFHLAAEVRFDLTLDEARNSNVLPTQNLIQLAKEIQSKRKFQHFHYLSTFAISGTPGQPIALEVPPDSTRVFRNTYEQTKAESELLLLAEAGQIPISIYRSSIIGGDSRNGWTSKFDTFYLAIRLFLSGPQILRTLSSSTGSQPVDLPKIRVPQSGRIDLVTIDFVADALFYLSRNIRERPSGTIFHLVGGEDSVPLSEILRQGSQHLATALKKAGEPVPEFPEIEEVEDLQLDQVGGSVKHLMGVENEIHQMIRRLLPYVFDTWKYDCTQTDLSLSDSPVRRRSFLDHFEAMIDYGVQSSWGEIPGVRPRLPKLKSLAESHPGDYAEPIAVIGMGGVFPNSKNIKEFWNFVNRGENAFSEKTISSDKKWVGGWIHEIDFDETRFRIPPLAAKSMDRLQKLVLLAATEAIEDSNALNQELTRHRTGMILGYSGIQVENDCIMGEFAVQNLIQKALPKGITYQTPNDPTHSPMNEDTLTGSLPNVAVGRVMNYFDLRGPSYVVNSGDSSSLAALDQACDTLRNHEADVMIAGGAHALSDELIWNCYFQEGLLHTPFTAQPRFGEGAGIFILKRLTDAVRDQDRVYALIRGIGRANNGQEGLIQKTSSSTLLAAIHQSFSRAGTLPTQIDYIETQGLGHAIEDSVETAVIEQVYSKEIQQSHLSARIGNLCGASAAASTLKAALTLFHQDSAGNLRQAGIQSFGSWGQAYHLILERWITPDQWIPPNRDEQVFAPKMGKNSASPSIAIVRAGTILPGISHIEDLWEGLIAGKSQITQIPDSKCSGHPEAFYDPDPNAENKTYGMLGAFSSTPKLDWLKLGIPPRAAQRIDPSHLQFLGAALQCIDSGAISKKTAIIVGESKSGQLAIWNAMVSLMIQKHGDSSEISNLLKERLLPAGFEWNEDIRPGAMISANLARLAKAFQIQSGWMSIDAACASSLAALQVAVRELQIGKLDQVIWGGVGVSVTPANCIPFAKCRALSGTGSAPFDESADGIVLGEGSAVFILKRLEDAERKGDPILAVIRGIGASSDGKGQSMMAPSRAGQILAMQRALEQARCTPESISWIECHATGTPVGDESEVEAISQVYLKSRRPEILRIGSIKSQIGHTLGAAGAASILKACFALKNRVIPPTRIRTRTHPALRLPERGLRINTSPEPWVPSSHPRRAAVSAFGFGGTNWHVILEERPALKEAPISLPPLKRKSELKRLAFLFPGHGSPYPNAGRELYSKHALFRAPFYEANEILKPILNTSLESLIYSDFGTPLKQIEMNLTQPDFVQPLILILNMAYYRIVRELGLQPDFVYGHSVGEISAAVASGVLSFAEGLQISYERGRIFRDLKREGRDTGKMVAVFCSKERIELKWTDLFQNYPSLSLATINGPNQVVVSGGTPDIQGAIFSLNQHGISSYLLPIEVGWHSPLARHLGGQYLEKFLATADFNPPKIKLLSNVTHGFLSSDSEIIRSQIPSLWAQQLESQMDFPTGIHRLIENGVSVFMEIGPKRILSDLLPQILNSAPQTYFYAIDATDRIKNLVTEVQRVRT